MPGDGIAGNDGESNSSRHPSGGGGVLLRSAAPTTTTRARRWCLLLDEGGGLSSVVVVCGSPRRPDLHQVDKRRPARRGGGYRSRGLRIYAAATPPLRRSTRVISVAAIGYKVVKVEREYYKS